VFKKLQLPAYEMWVNFFTAITRIIKSAVKGKTIPVQGWTGPEVSRRLRFPGFKTIGTLRW